jgi:hypothetical protein
MSKNAPVNKRPKHSACGDMDDFRGISTADDLGGSLARQHNIQLFFLIASAYCF